MKNQFVGGLLLAGLLAAPLAAQMPEGYLDMYIAKVKMGKRVEFDSINKRMVELNRKNKGDAWLAYELTYGDDNTVYFVSSRTSYGAAEEGTNAFEGSMAKSLGKAGMLSMLTAFSTGPGRRADGIPPPPSGLERQRSGGHRGLQPTDRNGALPSHRHRARTSGQDSRLRGSAQAQQDRSRAGQSRHGYPDQSEFCRPATRDLLHHDFGEEPR